MNTQVAMCNNLNMAWCTVLLLLVSLATLTACFPTKEQNTTANSTDPNVIAIVLPKPLKGVYLTPEGRKLKEIYSWIAPLLSSIAQPGGAAVGNVGSGPSFLSSLFGQNSYAYPFPFRR